MQQMEQYLLCQTHALSLRRYISNEPLEKLVALSFQVRRAFSGKIMVTVR